MIAPGTAGVLPSCEQSLLHRAHQAIVARDRSVQVFCRESRRDPPGPARGRGGASPRSALRLEAEAAAADPDDLAEARRIRAEMDAIAAAWIEPA